MGIPLAVLIVEDSESDAELIVRLLQKAGYDLSYERVETADEVRVALERQVWNIVIADYRLPQFDALAALKLLQATGLDIPFIVVSGTVGEETAVAMMRAGAHDYLMKNNLSRLAPAVERELHEAEMRRERQQAEDALKTAYARLECMSSSNAVGVVLADAQGGLLEVNDYYLNVLGFTRSEFETGQIRWDERTPPEHLPADWRAIEGLRSRGICTPYEKEYIRKDGSRVWVLIADALVPGPDEKILALVVDITERKRAEGALSATEIRYRRLFESAKDGILILDAETGMIVDVNPFLVELLGFSREQFLERKIWELEVFKDIAANEASFAELRQKGYIRYEDMPLETADGRQIEAEFVSNVYEVDHHKVIQCNVRDITERKRAAEALRESEERYRTLFENAQIGIYRTTPGGRILAANPALIQMLGYSSFDELAVRNLEQDGFEPDYPRSRFKGQIERDGEVRGIESAWTRRDNSVILVRENARVVRGGNGAIRYYEGTVEDVTERKRAEEALRESEDKFKYVFDYSIVGKSITLPSGELSVNQAFCEMLGYTREDLQNQRWQDITHAEDIELTQRAIDPLLSGERDSVRFTKRYIHKDGAVVWTDVSTSLRRDKEGKPLYFMTTVSDITERKQMEDEIRKLNVELEQRVRDRTTLLEVANKELEAFAYSVSHDLRAPLRGIDGWSLALLEDYGDQLDEQARTYLARVRSETQRMGQLIDDLLQLSRVTRADMQKRPVDLSALAQAIAARLQEAQPQRRMEFILQPGLTANGDARLLEIALSNLLGNAVKFTGARAEARIEFGCLPRPSLPSPTGRGQGGEGPVYFVRDNGVGFDMAYVSKLFGAFQRMHRASEFPGTGIGLATVQRIVHRHGGRVWAEAEVDRGATFYFTLEEAK